MKPLLTIALAASLLAGCSTAPVTKAKKPVAPPLPNGITLAKMKASTPVTKTVARAAVSTVPPPREHYYFQDPGGTGLDYYVVEQLAGESLTFSWSGPAIGPWSFLAYYQAPAANQYTGVSIPAASSGQWAQFYVDTKGSTAAALAAARASSKVKGTKTFKTKAGKQIVATIIETEKPTK